MPTRKITRVEVTGRISQLKVTGRLTQSLVTGKISILDSGYESILAPSGLAAVTQSATEILVSFINNSTIAEWISIERSGDGITFAELDTTTGASYLDETCDSETTYYYRARAYYKGRYSSYSNIADATTESGLVEAPSDLIVTVINNGLITLDWINNATIYDGLSIERRTDGGIYAEIDTVLFGNNTHGDNTATNGHIYGYRLRAYKGATYSDYSNVAYSLPGWNKAPHFNSDVRGSLFSMPATSGQDDSVSTFGNLPAGAKWHGGALAPNGCIYGIPRASTTILKIDTSDDSVSTFGNLAGTNKWYGGVLAPNGCIYGIPYNSASVLKIDTSDDSVSTFGNLAGINKWAGGVLAPNGCIYGIPYNSASVLKIDTSDDSVSTFGNLPAGAKWFSGVLAPNGCIYGIPLASTTILKIDTSDDSVSTFGNLPAGAKWHGGALAPNGCIYGIPYNSASVLKIDTSDDSVSTFGNLAGTIKWAGGVLAPNGCIYGIPRTSTTILKIDTSDDSVSTFGNLAGTNKWVGGVLAPNGCIYGIPYNSASVLKILSNYSIDENIPLARVFNKF